MAIIKNRNWSRTAGCANIARQEIRHDRDCLSFPPAPRRARGILRPGAREEYIALVDRMVELAKTMPGYISHKGFFAEDDERVTIVEFEHEEGMRAWRMNPEHRAAQKKAREIYYSEYSVQVCNVVRESKFKLDELVPA